MVGAVERHAAWWWPILRSKRWSSRGSTRKSCASACSEYTSCITRQPAAVAALGRRRVDRGGAHQSCAVADFDSDTRWRAEAGAPRGGADATRAAQVSAAAREKHRRGTARTGRPRRRRGGGRTARAAPRRRRRRSVSTPGLSARWFGRCGASACGAAPARCSAQPRDGGDALAAAGVPDDHVAVRVGRRARGLAILEQRAAARVGDAPTIRDHRAPCGGDGAQAEGQLAARQRAARDDDRLPHPYAAARRFEATATLFSACFLRGHDGVTGHSRIEFSLARVIGTDDAPTLRGRLLWKADEPVFSRTPLASACRSCRGASPANLPRARPCRTAWAPSTASARRTRARARLGHAAPRRRSTVEALRPRGARMLQRRRRPDAVRRLRDDRIDDVDCGLDSRKRARRIDADAAAAAYRGGLPMRVMLS